MPNDLQRVGKSQHLESTQAPSSTVSVSSGSRPSSNYNNRSQVIGPQKGMHICGVILEVGIFCDIGSVLPLDGFQTTNIVLTVCKELFFRNIKFCNLFQFFHLLFVFFPFCS